MINGGSARGILASLAVGTGRVSVRTLPAPLTEGAGRREVGWRRVSLEGLTGARGREAAGRVGSREAPARTAGVGSLVMGLILVRVVTLLVVDWVVPMDTGGLVDCGRERSTKDERAGDLFSQLWINCWTLLARGVDD